MKDRVYLFSPPQVFGGAEVYQIRLAELMHLQQRFTVISPPSPELQRGIAKAGGGFVELNGNGGIAIRLAFLAWLWRNRKTLRQHAAALVLNGRGAAYFAPMVILITGISPVIICHTELTAKGADIKEWLFGWALHFARRAVAVSETVARQHIHRWPALPVSAIPNWIDSAPYKHCPVSQGAGAAPADIAVVGRLAENKGILDILAACSDVGGPDVHFYGEGPLHKTVEEMAACIPSLKAHGHVEALWQQLSRHAILLSASYSESFSYSVAEGIHAGLLCVVSDIPAHRELLGPDYPDALYFSPGDRHGLRAALAAARNYLVRTDGSVADIIGLAKARMHSRNGPDQARKDYCAVLLEAS
ncbi:glycosyltransferase family 4 protein [Janthinobacterium sp. HLX7-2]|uniref:glycosyltransferase family 4 protein n=1 Tax=Janthinobacterium sp. HLX7-2 TaxID=1259331 RepID=UPI003F1E7EBE